MKTSQKSPKDLQTYHPKIFMKSLAINDSTNNLDPIDAPKIQKPESRVRKWYKVV